MFNLQFTPPGLRFNYALVLMLILTSTFLFGQNNNPYLDSHVMEVAIEQEQGSSALCEGQRKEINDFLPSDIDLLANLILQYLTSEINPNYDESVDPTYLKYTVVASHSDFGSSGSGVWHSDNETFFSWHRDYIQELEQFLLDMGHPDFVPLPAWDPSIAMPAAFTTAVVDGVPPLGNTNFEANMYIVDGITCGQFENIDEFAGFIRSGSNPPNSANTFSSHNSVHGGISGAMGSVPTASGAAIFWLFHAHVDELYQCYQTRCQDCAPVFIRALGYPRNCDYCFDFTLNENANAFTVTLVDDNGNETNIPWTNSRRCIPNSYLQPGQNYSVILSATNATDGMCNAADEVEIQFIAPAPIPDKFGRGGCFGVIAVPQFPIPGPDEKKGFIITNTGPTRNFSFIQTQVMSGNSIIIDEDIVIEQNESISIEIPRSLIVVGYNIFSIIADDQAMDVDYIVID